MQVAQIHHKRYNIDVTSFIAIRVIEWLYVLDTSCMYIEIILLPDVCVCVCVVLGIRNGIEVLLNLKILFSGFYQNTVNSKYQVHMYI
jgi:choline-glycine betaine transporter